MNHGALPFDTALYDNLPISTLIYESVFSGQGVFQDYRIVYGNRVFAGEWEKIYHNRDYAGVEMIKSRLLDEYVLRMMEAFRTSPPHAFSTYIPQNDLHLHFQPVTDLPAPYAGFFLTNITDYEEQDSRVHFLRNIQQMENCAVLLRQETDRRMEVVYVSEDFAEMMECSVEEAMARMAGAGFLRTTHPEDRPLVRSMLKRRVSDEGTSELTIQKITAKGRHIWCNVHYAFIDDFSEHYVYCTYSNVTVLKEYEERLRSVYTSLGNNFYQTGSQTLAMFRVNLTLDSVEEIKGRDLYPTDTMNRPYSEVLRLRAAHFPIERERRHFLEAFDRKRLIGGYLEGRVTETQVLYTRRRDGHMCYVDCTAVLTRHPLTGDMIAFITERECNDDKLRQTLLNTILVRQFDMVAWLTGGRYGVSIGDAARITRGSIFPTTRSGSYQQYLEGQVLPVLTGTEEERAAMAEALSLRTISERLRTQETYVVNITIQIDGEIFHKRFDFYPVDPDSEFYVVLKSDTTEIQQEQSLRNEQLRLALEEARAASVAKTAFLSSMSHEIRTPMNAIIGLDDIALKDPDLPARTREQLNKIGVSARHLLSLINDILDMSRIESGRMTLKNEEFFFKGFLEQINILISSQCQDKGLEYSCVLKSGLDAYYIGDDMKLKQVLINILGNSVKFTEPPGSVTLTVERTADFEGQTTLRFVIRDTGIGMDAAFLPKLFEAFSQEDATTTNKYGGSGLGMAITKNIVEMMNGNISVTSEKGVGSEFTVNVTLLNARSTGTGEQTALPPDLRVLIADHDPAALEYAARVLEETGIAADTCASGKEALELIGLHSARRSPYGVILLDLHLKDLDGIAVTREIRRRFADDPAVVMLTAYQWADAEAEAVEAGADGFLSKPLYAPDVLTAFQNVSSHRQAESAPEPADLTGRRILLAEDMEINAEIMLELLDMGGMTGDHAENGQAAADLFAQSAPGTYDAVLMDVRMPVLDGLGAARAIRAMDRPDAQTVPIIAMTANAFDEDVQRSLQAGMNAHLTKPVEPERLYETLRSLIGAREQN